MIAIRCNKIKILAFLTMIFPQFVMAEECSIDPFRASIAATRNDTTRLSIAWHISEMDYNRSRMSGDAAATILGVPVGVSYREFRENIRRQASSLRLENFEQRSLAYATSGIDATGLAAYQSCLAARGGFHITLLSQSVDSYRVQLLWLPPVGTTSVSWRVLSHSNLSEGSLEALRATVSRMTGNRQDQQVLISPQDPEREVSLAIGFGAGSRTLVLPPLRVAMSQPPRSLLSEAFSGRPIFFVISPESCNRINFGTLLCGYEYIAQYNHISNAWTVTGYNLGGGMISTHVYSNQPRAQGILNAWGRHLAFDETGALYDTRGDRPLIGRVYLGAP
jgi:hypothetical protein